MRAGVKGRRLEHALRDILTQCGFSVIRSAASKTPFDLVAFSPRVVWLCQVKSNRWPSPAEREEMRRFPAPPGVRKWEFRFDDGNTFPEKREVT